MKYNDLYTPLFVELGKVIKPYNFPSSTKYEIEDIGYKENTESTQILILI